MTILGIDISHWSNLADYPVDLKEQGYDFLIWKSTEGSHYVDSTFPRVLPAAYGDVLFAAFHYMDDSNVDDQVTLINQTVPAEVPVIIDMEKGSLGTAVAIHQKLQATGRITPFFYLPHWYWEQIGKPDISHLPPLWASSWVDGNDYGSRLYEKVAIKRWEGYGGSSVGMLQFTSTGKLDGITGYVDISACPVDRETLAVHLRHVQTTIPPAPKAPAVIRYTVRKGDTLTSIAREFHSTVSVIYAANHGTIGSNPDRIFPGMVLSIQPVR
jgi:lysozyme